MITAGFWFVFSFPRDARHFLFMTLFSVVDPDSSFVRSSMC